MEHERIETSILQAWLEHESRLVKFGLHAMSDEELRQFRRELSCLSRCIQDCLLRRDMGTPQPQGE